MTTEQDRRSGGEQEERPEKEREKELEKEPTDGRKLVEQAKKEVREKIEDLRQE